MSVSKVQASPPSSGVVEQDSSDSAKSHENGEGVDVSTIRSLEVPTVSPESGEGIKVGAVKLMEVPAVPLGSYSPDGQDTDLSHQVKPELRKPEPFEKFVLCVLQVLETVLLVLRTGVKGFEPRYYFVDPALQAEIAFALKSVVVIPWWSLRDRRWCLWVVNASEESPYFANLKPILEQPEEFYRGVSFTVLSEKESSRYRFRKFSEARKFPADPGRPTGVMLGQAIGARGFIRDVSHPVYEQLIAGEEVVL